MNRRTLIRGGLAAALGIPLLGCGRRRSPPADPALAKPATVGDLAARPGVARAVVLIHLDGGIDPVLSTLPRRRDQVNAEVDIPYEPDHITGTEALSFGPNFAALAEFGDRLAVLNGVHVDTANHSTGWVQLPRLRTRAFASMPTILDLVGAHRQSQPLPTIHFGEERGNMYSSAHAHGFLSFELHGASENELLTLAQQLKAHAQSLRATGTDDELRNTAKHYDTVAALAERLISTPKFVEADWNTEFPTKHHLQRVLWALEHDLTASAYIRVRPSFNWDSHNHNLNRQAVATSEFMPAFVRFLRELPQRQGPAGSLADSTLVVVASEIGRFPRLNGNDGKDHFPELPVMMYGAGVRGGASYGAVDERLLARPIDLSSGHALASGAGHRVTLDDVGATVLRMAGIEPAPYGYDGADLAFLRRPA